MDSATIILFWKDTNWIKKGVMENIWFYIYTGSRTYRKVITPSCSIYSNNIVEVKKKSAITEMIEYLNSCGFTEDKR